MAKLKAVAEAVFFDGFELPRNGSILTFAATIAKVGVYDGAWWNVRGERGEGGRGQELLKTFELIRFKLGSN